MLITFFNLKLNSFKAQLKMKTFPLPIIYQRFFFIKFISQVYVMLFYIREPFIVKYISNIIYILVLIYDYFINALIKFVRISFIFI